MTRRPDLENLYIAHRMGLAGRLRSKARMGPDAAEQWITAWEAEAALRGLDRRSELFWRPAWDWIAERRDSR